jgi:hypothetical protein
MQEVSYSLHIYLSLYSNFKTEYDLEMQEFLLQWIIGNFTENVSSQASKNPKQTSFQLNIILSFLANMIDAHGVIKFNNMTSHIP